MINITNKTEAYDYLYDVFNNVVEHDDEKIKQAKSYFDEFELQCLDFVPEIDASNCFKCILNKCNH